MQEVDQPVVQRGVNVWMGCAWLVIIYKIGFLYGYNGLARITND